MFITFTAFPSLTPSSIIFCEVVAIYGVVCQLVVSFLKPSHAPYRSSASSILPNYKPCLRRSSTLVKTTTPVRLLAAPPELAHLCSPRFCPLFRRSDRRRVQPLLWSLRRHRRQHRSTCRCRRPQLVRQSARRRSVWKRARPVWLDRSVALLHCSTWLTEKTVGLLMTSNAQEFVAGTPAWSTAAKIGSRAVY